MSCVICLIPDCIHVIVRRFHEVGLEIPRPTNKARGQTDNSGPIRKLQFVSHVSRPNVFDFLNCLHFFEPLEWLESLRSVGVIDAPDLKRADGIAAVAASSAALVRAPARLDLTNRIEGFRPSVALR